MKLTYVRSFKLRVFSVLFTKIYSDQDSFEQSGTSQQTIGSVSSAGWMDRTIRTYASVSPGQSRRTSTGLVRRRWRRSSGGFRLVAVESDGLVLRLCKQPYCRLHGTRRDAGREFLSSWSRFVIAERGSLIEDQLNSDGWP